MRKPCICGQYFTPMGSHNDDKHDAITGEAMRKAFPDPDPVIDCEGACGEVRPHRASVHHQNMNDQLMEDEFLGRIPW